MSHGEESIAKTQLKGKDGVEKFQKRGIANLDDRIFIYLGGIAFLGMCVVWATAKSAWILYGSFALTILMVVLWGIARMKRIDRVRQERAEQARAVQTDRSG